MKKQSTTKNDEWARLEIIMNTVGNPNISTFARSLGIRAENLYQIRRGSNHISRDLANLINSNFPQFSRGWIMFGEDNTFIVAATRHKQIPFYDNINDYIVHKGRERSLQMALPEFLIGQAQFVTVNTEKTMAPLIPRGAFLFMKEVKELFYQSLYYVQTPNDIVLRILSQHRDPNKVYLVAHDQKKYNPMEISKKDLLNIYEVCAVHTIIPHKQ